MIRLSHPAPDDGQADIQDAVNRMFTDRPSGLGVADLWEFGWPELLDDAPSVATQVMFEAQGRRLASAATLDGYVVHEVARRGGVLSEPERTSVLFGYGAGRTQFAMIDSAHPPTHFLFQSFACPDQVRVITAAAADVRAVPTVDPSIDLVQVVLGDETDSVAVVDSAPGLIPQLAQMALSYQLVGTCNRLLELGREYVMTRHQFGRPIGTFQAVQHLLAEAVVSIAAAQHATANANETRSELAYLIAAGASCRAIDTTTRAIQQVLGAVGYTSEHEFHHYLRRGLLLSFLLDSDSLNHRIGDVIHAAAVPVVAPIASWFDFGQEAGNG